MKTDLTNKIEVKVVCAYCKRLLRGQELWDVQGDVCRTDNGGVISHAICPDCLLHHYPNEYLAIQEEKKVRIRNVFKKGFAELYGHLAQ